MNNLVLVQIVNGIEHLLDGLRSILFGEFSLLADTIEKLTTGGKLSDNVEFVLEGNGYQYRKE